MQLQAVGGAAKAVGENNVGTGLNKALVQGLDAVRVIDVPKLGGIAGHQAHVKQVTACGAICQQPGAGGQQAGKPVIGGFGHVRNRHGNSVGDRANGPA